MTGKFRKENRIIIVLGMHRSGTSAITKSLELFGVGLGSDLHPAGFDNPSGFWEDRECIEINDTLLSHLGSAYDRLDLAWNEIVSDSEVKKLRDRAIQLVSRRLQENSGCWGFKDPRTCRLLSFWNEVFLALECNVDFVVAVRNPASVAASLLARNAIPVEKSYFLWLQHVLPSLSCIKDARRVVVDYDEFLANPYSQIARISAELKLPLPKQQSDLVKGFEKRFLKKRLRHTHFSAADLAIDNKVSGIVVATYSLLCRLAKDQGYLGDLAIQDEIEELNSRLKDVSPAFLYINALEDGRSNLWHTIGERDEQIGNLSTTVSEKEEQISSLHLAVGERDEQIGNLSTTVSEKEEQISSLNLVIGERDEQLNVILRSNSWRFTLLIRVMRRYFITIPLQSIRRLFSNMARGLWKTIPISNEKKASFKGVMFKALPILFKHTNAYRAWQAFTGGFNYNKKLLKNESTLLSTANEHVSLSDDTPVANQPVQLIAFYLPQFHAIPENNEWWGAGFTEWTNVKPAKPQFEGHDQPHKPGELGYYNLQDVEVMRRQSELAKLYGVSGFCFYFYWFAGKRLLESPILQYLETKDIEHPFCLCWANENWSRRWDGLDSEILIAQDHSAQDDIAFIKYVSKYLNDSRYIRIDEKPLLLVYRPSLLPSPKKTVKRWRDWCRNNGVGEIYLAYTQSFESADPKAYGFDAAIEFPPNNTNPPLITENAPLCNDDFMGVLYDWSVFPERSEKYNTPDYMLFRGVCPSWDNTARRKNNGTVFLNSSPQGYQQWLSNAVFDTVARIEKKSERFVFINAWNEWAEGAYLEPDEKYGYAYLQATKDALESCTVQSNHRRIILVAHDAHPHGAQNLILHMAKSLSEDFSFVVDMVVLGEGRLLKEYARYANIHSLAGKKHTGREAHKLVETLFAEGISTAITNTVVTGKFAAVLKEHGFTVISLVHELPGVIKDNQLEEHVALIASCADKVVFPAEQVKEGFDGFSKVIPEKSVIRPQGMFRKNCYQGAVEIKKARHLLRKQFNLPDDAVIVLNIGFADKRKGIDLFVDIALKVLQDYSNVYFIWVGHFDPSIEPVIQKKIKESEMDKYFIFPGLDFNSDIYYAGANVFSLTSREDPFPCVVLEAFDAGLPVIAFEGTGGFTGLLERGAGKIVPSYNTDLFAVALGELIKDSKAAVDIGKAGKLIVEQEFSFRHYLFDLLDLADVSVKRVSVIVPNYNYARYLLERIRTVVEQVYPVYEIIILDDESSDESIELLEDLIPNLSVDVKFVSNEQNSGNPFVQWLKGVELAEGDYVWIAEADDLSTPEFLDEVMKAFTDPFVVMSYCQSKQITSTGDVLCNHYLDYLSDVSADKWMEAYSNEGVDEIKNALAIKNTIPNVSAVVFDRKVILKTLKKNINEIKEYRVAGDWLTYLSVLENGKIAFSPKAFNLHRRHNESITLGSFNISQLTEILSVQKIARDSYAPDPKIIKKALVYSEGLYEKFGLATDAAPALRSNAELKDLL